MTWRVCLLLAGRRAFRCVGEVDVSTPPSDEVFAAEEGESEATRVLRWRLHQALELGLTRRDALIFATSEADLEELRQRIRQGGPPQQVLRIVL